MEIIVPLKRGILPFQREPKWLPYNWGWSMTRALTLPGTMLNDRQIVCWNNVFLPLKKISFKKCEELQKWVAQNRRVLWWYLKMFSPIF